jgi:hypothetical protein
MNDMQRHVGALKAAVPGFKTLWPDDLPNMVVGDLGIVLRDRISKYGLTDPVAREVLELVGEMLNGNNDPELQNLLQVGIFEPLCDRSETVSFALALLTGDSRTLFLKTLDWAAPTLKPGDC